MSGFWIASEGECDGDVAGLENWSCLLEVCAAGRGSALVSTSAALQLGMELFLV